jgi:hypothetical protein
MCVAASFLGSILLSNFMNPSALWKQEQEQQPNGTSASAKLLPAAQGWAACCAVGFACAFLAVILSAVRIAGGPNGKSGFFIAANIAFVMSVLLDVAAMLVFGYTMYGLHTFVACAVVCGGAAVVVAVATLCSLSFHT